ncbi:Peptidase C1 and/or Inhibitor I29 domain containing protein [Asbolus verrucosus]|uniref:Peptidase C1 and/or Inhibitor I29 domain containing protein n=1 Tax=Asbolus verrucosus TaxID=1661398 RepID=A0A482VMI7_ASBVE|nr:Peptidase C1 and/or Inhibitor I29 domain containing protein [Asbolus verrucosus]
MDFLAFFLLFSSISVFSCEDTGSEVWATFKVGTPTNLQTTYNKIYKSTKEEKFRKEIFLKNLQKIEDHNRKYYQNLVTYTMKVNHFADRTDKELYPLRKVTEKSRTKISKPIPKTDAPESIDWRDFGVITPIVDQAYCESCWAFAVVAAIEAHVGIYLGRKNETLSQQNLVDCVNPTFECHQDMESHATLEDSYRYIIDNGGIDTAESYPYEAMTGNGCRFNPNTVGAKVQDYVTINEGDEDALKTVVGTIGPVSVIISTDFTFIMYSNGVYYKENCTYDTRLPYNHAVTVIGYGSENGEDYWLVRNEWGHYFGDDGYIKMARNRDNHCGIATYASYPIVVN